ncbi:peptidyl-tRNA hydrolase ArfB [bacterium BMS3Abin05]|nr:peptidyl-tRNA hydrolase ArfB [bacterium BMS3Abin05]GBE28089.1 peptidyl-tRNA hydrolase ArfB [bacterium BMS3Bbin03]
MIQITPDLVIPDDEIHFKFVRSSGPGGQNVNKVATAVQLRFDAAHSPSLDDILRARLQKLAGNRMTGDGILIIEASRFRTQEQNRKDAVERFVKLILEAVKEPKVRKRSRLPLTVRRRRQEAKRHRSEIKKWRRPVSFDGA